MNIPEDVQQAVEQAFIWAYDSFRDASGCPKGDDICDVAYAIWQRWLESQPEAPETIPDDVRAAMRQALEFCAGDYWMTGDRYDHFEAALAWLDAQPDAPQTVPEEERVTIPEDVRGWINSRAAEAANTPDSLGVTEAERQTARRVQDWLDAQPAAPKRWELAKHGFRFSQTDEDGDITLIVVDNLLGYPPKLLISIHGVLGLVELPDNLRLFCCTEATG